MTTTTTTAAEFLAAEPTIKVNLANRHVKVAWTGAVVGDSTFQVQLSIFHHKDRKVFGASVVKVEVVKDEGSPFVVEKYLPFDSVRLLSTPVARFSEKAMLAAAEESIAYLRSLADQPAIQEVVTKAVEGVVEYRAVLVEPRGGDAPGFGSGASSRPA